MLGFNVFAADTDEEAAFRATSMQQAFVNLRSGCLLYTSDAADDLLCVDLGGRRIITKKKTKDLFNSSVS